MDKQSRQSQFSENMKDVMYGGSVAASSGVGSRTSSGAGQRTRSPGLRAGAALALGNPASASEAHSEARDQCRQAVDHARRQTCPFDDHSAFGAVASDRAHQPRMPVLEQAEVAAATKDSRNCGNYNRDIAHKVGAGSPFDAPFASDYTTSSGNRRVGAPPALPEKITAYHEAIGAAGSQAAANKTRMRGHSDLLGGYQPEWHQQGQQSQRPNLPPRPENQVAARGLLPQAMFKLQYDGSSVKNLTCAKSEFLNVKVMMEANRERNNAGISLG